MIKPVRTGQMRLLPLAKGKPWKFPPVLWSVLPIGADYGMPWQSAYSAWRSLTCLYMQDGKLRRL